MESVIGKESPVGYILTKKKRRSLPRKRKEKKKELRTWLGHGGE